MDAPKTFKPKTPKSDLRRSNSIKGNSSITLSGSSTDGIAMKNVMAKLTSIDQRLDALDAKMDELKTLFSSNRGRKSVMNIRLTKLQVLAYKLLAIINFDTGSFFATLKIWGFFKLTKVFQPFYKSWVRGWN